MHGCLPMFDDETIEELADVLALVVISIRNSFNYVFNYSLSALKILRY